MVITYSSTLVVIRHSSSFDHYDVWGKKKKKEQKKKEKSFRLPCLGAALFHSALTHFVLECIGCIRVELLYSTFIKQPSLRLWSLRD